jgi:DmsE family decaheme c-type cytochrome
MSLGKASARARRRPIRAGARLAATAVTLGIALACVGSWQPPQQNDYRRTEAVAGAGGRIGSQACSDCHASFEGHSLASDAHADCEACHGPAQLHEHTARAGDIGYPGNEDCAACHQLGRKTLLGWSTSAHARVGVLCSDCHDTHNRELWHLREAEELGHVVLPRATPTTLMCSSCHAEVVAQLGLPSHHPVGEGMLECTDCHGAHEDRAVALGAPTRICADCHQEVMGPWIYEHEPVTEDCGYCHAPHGASADFLLEVSQPAACISCHTVATSGAIHDPYAFTTRCTDCHNAVHGSYTDPVLRR